MDNVLLIIHILAAATWFGANMVQFFVAMRLRKADNAIAAEWQRMTVALGKGLYSPAVILLFITGFGLVGTSDGAFEIGDPFVILGIVVVVIGAVVGIRIVGPQGEKAATAYDDGDRAGAEAIITRVSRVALVDTLLLVVAIVAMVNLWGI